MEEISKLPGIGKKTALRLALFLLNRDELAVENLAQAISNLKKEVNFCRTCYNISDKEICEICANPHRTEEIICVVEDVRDVLAIENTQQYVGRFHVLGGIISPMDGIGPDQLHIAPLVDRVKTGNVAEVILALNATMEGDTTNFYIYRKLQNFDVRITTIARGIAVGDSLEYTDEITLGRSLQNRIPFENSLKG